MPGLAVAPPTGGATGKTLQAPIRGLQRAFSSAQEQSPLMLPGQDEEAPDRSGLGQRAGSMPMNALSELIRRFGRVY